MFRIGDYVVVKPNTKLDTGERVSNWGGKVEEVYEVGSALVALDALTLDMLDDRYLRDAIDAFEESTHYIFPLENLEKSERRDTDTLLEEARKSIADRIDDLLENDNLEEQPLFKEFESAPEYNLLDTNQKENASFIISTFLDFMYNYEGVELGEWSPSNIEEVCLNLVPRKVSADQELFEIYGDVVIIFLQFLENNKYIANADILIKKVIAIKSKIPIESKKTGNWGIAKTMMMQAMEMGLDLDNEEEMDDFLLYQQLSAMNNLFEEEEPIVEPWKNIGRNQKITVKYKDGQVIENIKFKKVKSDLVNGNCILLKKPTD